MESEVKTNVGMGCYEHPEKTVVATCKACGKFMCRDCAEKYESKLCEACEAQRIANEQQAFENEKAQLKQEAKDYKNMTIKELIKIGVISGVLAIIGASIGAGDGAGTAVTMAWLLAGFPWGWRIINQIMTGNFMLWLVVLTQKFWLIAYLIKFALAFLIGAVLWPFKLGISIYRVVSAKKTENDIKNI